MSQKWNHMPKVMNFPTLFCIINVSCLCCICRLHVTRPSSWVLGAFLWNPIQTAVICCYCLLLSNPNDVLFWCVSMLVWNGKFYFKSIWKSQFVYSSKIKYIEQYYMLLTNDKKKKFHKHKCDRQIKNLFTVIYLSVSKQSGYVDGCRRVEEFLNFKKGWKPYIFFKIKIIQKE